MYGTVCECVCVVLCECVCVAVCGTQSVCVLLYVAPGLRHPRKMLSHHSASAPKSELGTFDRKMNLYTELFQTNM